MELDPLLAWMLERAGVNPRCYRPRALERRLAACLRHLGVNNRVAARQLLERQPKLLSSALNTVLIGVSEFFRDRAVFTHVQTAVLPELLATRRGVRVYAPGVSNGQELYSVAMLLAEAGALAHSELTGIDCRPDAITWASAGIFGEASLEDVPEAWREKYFFPMWGGWQARPELARHTRWHVANLFAYTEPAAWDLILFRNVAIYFDEAPAERAWELLCDQLAPGGYLVTGKAEKPPRYLPLVRRVPSIYQKENS